MPLLNFFKYKTIFENKPYSMIYKIKSIFRTLLIGGGMSCQGIKGNSEKRSYTWKTYLRLGYVYVRLHCIIHIYIYKKHINYVYYTMKISIGLKIIYLTVSSISKHLFVSRGKIVTEKNWRYNIITFLW